MLAELEDVLSFLFMMVGILGFAVVSLFFFVANFPLFLAALAIWLLALGLLGGACKLVEKKLYKGIGEGFVEPF